MIGILGLGGMNVLPWVRIFERVKDKRFKITAIVFMAIIGLVVVLWIICEWRVVAFFNMSEADIANMSSEDLVKTALDITKTVQVTTIISLQFMIASGIAMNIVKYRKTQIPYQVMGGVSMVYIDFVLSLLLTAVSIEYDAEAGMDFLFHNLEILSSPIVWAMLLIAAIILIIVSIVFARTDRRRLIATANIGAESSDSAAAPEKSDAPVADDPPEEKLKRLQSLYDSGLISQDEYEQKRADILKNI